MNNNSYLQHRFEHRFYLGFSFVFLALVLWTFMRTFYLKMLFGTPPLPLLLHIHGVVMTGWVMLLAMQSSLAAAYKLQWHRRVGVFGAVWAALVVVLGSTTTLHAALREVRAHSDFAAGQIVVTTLELLQMLFFASFVAIAIWQRNRPDYHKRLMLMTIPCMLPSALARLPVSFMTNQLIMLGLDGFILACVMVDTFRNRRLHPAFGWGALLFVIAFHLTLYYAPSRIWIEFAGTLLS